MGRAYRLQPYNTALVTSGLPSLRSIPQFDHHHAHTHAHALSQGRLNPAVSAAVPALVCRAPIMYGPSYGFGSPPADDSSPFNHPHQPQPQQQGQQGYQGEHGQQLPQHMMYNPQAYGAAPQQPMYDGSGAAVMGGSPDEMEMAGMQLQGGGTSILFLLLSRGSLVVYVYQDIRAVPKNNPLCLSLPPLGLPLAARRRSFSTRLAPSRPRAAVPFLPMSHLPRPTPFILLPTYN